MSDLKRHNPLSLGLHPEPPDWVSPEGVKWWGINIGDPQDGHVVLIEQSEGDQEYVILNDKGVFYATRNLQSLASKFDQLRLIRTMK